MPIPSRSTRQLPLQLELWIGQRSIVPGNQSSDKDQSVPGHGYEAQPVRTLILYDGTSARGCRVVERLLGYEDKGWMDAAIIGPDLCDRKNGWPGVGTKEGKRVDDRQQRGERNRDERLGNMVPLL